MKHRVIKLVSVLAAIAKAWWTAGFEEESARESQTMQRHDAESHDSSRHIWRRTKIP